MTQPNINLLEGYQLDNMKIKIPSNQQKQEFCDKITKYIKNGQVYKLPEHMTVMDILRCSTELKPLLAARYGYLGLIKYLVENGYDLNCETNDKDNMLLLACHGGQYNVVDYLLQNKFDINFVNTLNENSYLYGTGVSIEFMEYLESKGANIHQLNKFDEDALVYAIDKNKEDIIRYLCEVKEFKINPNHNIDALARACYRNSMDIVPYLTNIVKKPDLFGCYYWMLVHNNLDMWNFFKEKYNINMNELKKHQLNLFQNMTNLFIFINFRPFSKLMKQYNSIQKWSILNFLENQVDINHVTTTKINTFMVIMTSGNLQLIDYYKNKYNYGLLHRNDTSNDLYTLAICNKSYSVIKYLALHGLNMEFININYINYKRNRYYYDIYALYINYLNQIKLIIDDDDIIMLTDFTNYKDSDVKDTDNWYKNNIIQKFDKSDIDTECVICKENFKHMDEVIVCSNYHMCHSVCLMTTLNNDAVKYADCLICFQQAILHPSNLYIWFSKPDIDYLKERELEKKLYLSKLESINKMMPSKNEKHIYPITITESQYNYAIEDLRVTYNQDINETNLNSYNMCFTGLYDVHKFIDGVIQDKFNLITFDPNNIDELCTYLDMGWYNIYKSMVHKDEETIDAEAIQNNPQLLNQLLQHINQQNNQNNNNQPAEPANNNEEEDNVDINQENIDEHLMANNDDIIIDEDEEEYDEDEYDEEEYDEEEYDEDDNFPIVESDDTDPYLDPVDIDEEMIYDDEAPVYGSIINKTEYDRLNVFMNNLYYKHMMRRTIIDKFIMTPLIKLK